MNTDNLRTFLQGDGIWILTAIAVLLAIKAWRNSSWLQLFSVVGFYAVIVSIAKGQDPILDGRRSRVRSALA